MPSNIQFKRGTAAALYALNPVLLRGEPGLEIDTNKVKYGNGVTPWRDLPYSNPALEVVDGGEFTAGAVPAVPGTFSPPTLPGLKLWLDADNVDYVHRVANRVSLWEDASDSDAKFVQSNKANRPTVANQLANQDVVTFDGENDAMIGKLDLPEEFTLLVALRRRGASADGKVIAAYTANNNTELVLCGTETGGEFGVFFDGEYSATQAVDNLVPVVYTLQFSLAGLSTRLNGLNTVSVEGFTVPPMTHLSLGGSRSDFADDNYSGDIAEIVLYDSVLSAADLLDAENYMMERWSVVSAVHPLCEGMKAFWPLNEETGARLDITAAEVPLTPTGTVGFDSGVIENAAEFTGGNNYLQAPSDFALDGSFAISAWFKAASMAGGRSVLVQNWAAGNASGQVELGFGDDGSDTNAVFGRIATDDDIYTVVVPDLEANLWHHVVLVYSATANTLTLYLNGSQAAQVATLGSFSAGNIPLRVGIGDQTATQNDLACVVDQLGIWDRVLSLQDVQMLYNYELGKEDFTADVYGDNVSLLLHMDKPANAGVGTDGGNGDPYFNDVSLLLHMDGANGSTTFTDSSANAVTVTANGSAAISTAQSKFGGSSLSLGNGYLDSGDFSDFEDMSEGDWTLEAWVWRPSSVGDATVLNLSNTINVPYGLHLWIGSDDALRWDEGTQQCAIGGVVPREQWVHIAAARANGTVTIYVDGTSVGSSAIAPLAGPYRLLIGAMQPNNIGFTSEMYIDDLRITKGVARYTANFTPPTAEFPNQAGQSLLDPDFDKVSLLLKMDGANGSTNIVDSSPLAGSATAEGTVQISTAQSKFGGASLKCPDTDTDYLDGFPGVDLSSGSWTVECWFLSAGPSVVNNQQVLGAGSQNFPNRWIMDVAVADNSIYMRALGAGNTPSADSFPSTPTPYTYGSWAHLAWVNNADANEFKMYVNGVQVYSGTAFNLPKYATVQVGQQAADFGPQEFYIDELRITQGLARYTAAFTPPTASFPLGYTKVVTMPTVETALLLHFDGASFVDSGENGLTVTANGATLSTTESKFGGSSGYFNGSGSWLSIPDSSLWDFVNAGDFTIEMWLNFTDTEQPTSICGQSGGGGGNPKWGLYWNAPVIPGSALGFHLGSAGDIVFGQWSPVAGDWYHLALCRSGDDWYAFSNGTLIGTVNDSARPALVSSDLRIGADGENYRTFNGYIDELRITKGAALYTANFMPPTLPFPNPPAGPALLLHFDGANGSTTFTDSGKNGLTVTANGDAAISTAQSKFGGSSLFMSRSGGGYLSIPYSSALDFGTGDFTAEWWMRLSNTSDTSIFGGATQCGTWSVNCATEVRMGVGCTGWDLSSSGWVCPVEQWVHVAVARHSGTLRFFADGAEIASAPNSVSYVLNPTDMLTIGTSQAPYTVEGYIDDVRIVKGAAVYTANFTPPTEPFATTSTPAPDLLLHFDGANGSTTFTDSGKNQLAVTRAGNAAISTAQSRFGGASAYFDAASALTIAPTAAIDLSSGDWTVETWWRPESDSSGVGDGSHTLITVGESAAAAQVRISAYAGVSAFRLLCSTGAGWLDTTLAGTYAPAQWHHVAATRAGDNFRLFIDGLQVLSFTYAGSLLTNPGPTYIGADANLASAASFSKGHIDELRIIKGTALYTENFNPPAAPFLNPTITLVPPPGVDPYFNNVSMLLHMDGENNGTTFVDSSPNALAVVATGDAVVSTGEIKFGSASGYFNGGSNSFLTAPASANFAYGTEDFTIECWVNSADLSSWHVIYGQSTSGNNYCVLGTENGLVQFIFNYSNPGAYVYGGSITADTWHHIAVCRKEGMATVYVDGVGGVPAACTFDFANTTFTPQVGSYGHSPSYNFDGYIDELRVTKGVARYTDNFTPPTAAFPDAAGGGGGGTGPITTFIDTSKHNHEVAATGSAYLNLEDIKYGNASGEFAGGHCEIAMSPEFAFDDGDFTVEFWGKLSYVQYSAVFSTASTAEEAGTYLIGFSDDTNMFGFCYDMDNFTFVSANIAEYYNTWAHYAFVRLDGVLKMYINGAEVATANTNINLDGGTQTTAVIGRRWTNEDDYYLDGLIDDFRITKGVARYIAEFNPPTKALPDPVIPPATQPTGDPYAENVTLLLHMDGANGSAVFTDNSYLQNTVTDYGNAAISTAQSKFGGASVLLQSDDCLTVDGDFDLESADYTVEWWMRFTSTEPNDRYVCFENNSGETWGLINNNSTLDWNYFGSSSPFSVTFPALGYWNHYAITKIGSTRTFYIDGVSQGTTTSAVIPTGASRISIGASTINYQLAETDCYIDDLRITKGVARYTANFTPPTVPFPNPFVPGPTADLLLHFDGADGSTTFTDSSTNALTVTANGNAQISTAQSKFGGASLALAGAGTLVVASSNDFAFGSDDFTVEVWVFLNSTAGPQHIMEWRNYDENNSPAWYISDGNVRWYVNAADRISASANITANQWHHLAVCRSGGITKLFIDGVQSGSDFIDSTNYQVNPTNRPLIGGYSPSTAVLNGYIDELRVIKSTAVYTSNFTPPTAPFRATADVTPTDVTGCDLWLDSTGDIGEVNGTIVTWADKSGNGRTATPADYAPAPFVAVGEGPNGQDVVRFSGDPNVLDVGYQFNLKNSSGFMVFKQANNDHAYARILSFQPDSGLDYNSLDGATINVNAPSDRLTFYNASCTGNYGNDECGAYPTTLPLDWTLLSYTVNADGLLKLRVNGEEVSTTLYADMAAKQGGDLFIGHGGSLAANESLIGDIAEIVIFDHALGEAALIALERGLINRCLPPPPFNTVLLLHMDGANGSTTFTDSSANTHAVTSNGNAAISTTESKFDGASGDFTGYGDNVQVTPTDPEMFAYGTGDFTIEGWIYPTAPDPGTTIYSQVESGFNYLALQISEGNLFLDHGSANPGTYVWGPAVSNNTWQHFALCRHNGVMRLYLDGVGGDPVNSAFDFNNLTYLPTIGGYAHTAQYGFNGYIDELRITKGAALYTGNFTPPTAPFNT